MSNLEKYQQAFGETFMVEKEKLSDLKYQDIPEWDSVGHMALMAALEESFQIELDIDDIIEFSSFVYGKEILKKYEVINVVLSDIAVNTTGNKKLDSFKTNSICLDILGFAYKNLCNGGYLLCKFFNGELDKEIIKFSKLNFSNNKIIKPKSSRKDSKEMYLFCKK